MQRYRVVYLVDGISHESLVYHERVWLLRGVEEHGMRLKWNEPYRIKLLYNFVLPHNYVPFSGKCRNLEAWKCRAI